MKYTPIILFFVTTVFMHSVSFAQHAKFSDAERTIIRLQDNRQGTDTIIRYLDSKDEKVAWRAAIALANIGDTDSRPALVKHLGKEVRPSVFSAIAFALGTMGPDMSAFQGLLNTKNLKFTGEISYNDFFIALGRTVPKDHVDDLAFFLGVSMDQTKEKSRDRLRSVSYALIELGLRKLMNEKLIGYAEALDTNDDPVVRWQCAYSLARTEDSSLLAKHLDLIKVFLKDIGCPESRMFAATALGRVHNEEAGKMLVEAERSEVEWRVRVNIFNAFAKLTRFSSAIDDLIKKAVLESSKDSLTSNHVARAAIDALDQMIANGKVSSPDSVTVKEWLTDYLPSRELYQDQYLAIRSQCMIPLARLGADFERAKDIAFYLTYHDRTAEINTWKAEGLVPDTAVFFHAIQRVFTATESDITYVLDGLHSLWEIAKKDTSFLSALEYCRYASMYRHMLIRFARQSEDPAIVATTMEQIKDPLIVTDSLRGEAEEYLLKYLDKYAYPKYHDHLLSILNTVAWLKPKNDTFVTKINGIMIKAASEWGDRMIVDSAISTLYSLGVPMFKTPAVKLVGEPIDWKTIESLPDTLLINTQYGYMHLKLKTYDAPLTCLNMYKLAKLHFFANNYIHRVVPNFVIQSGDNTGTGDGGPGYSIRREVSPIRYDNAGTVGMASSGKDTEGSQWFITHCPTPHLNTRYTIWGEIVKEIENIEKYMLNDQIMDIIPYK